MIPRTFERKSADGGGQESIWSHPRVFGPGVWFSIHVYALNSKTEEEKRHFARFLWLICTHLKCGDCQEHCKAYMETHPIESFFHVRDASGEDIGIFKYTWMFHNAVNHRLRKPELDWDTAYHMYSSSEKICIKGCGEEERESLPSFPPLPSVPPPLLRSGRRTLTPSIQGLSRKLPSVVQVVPPKKSVLYPYK